MIYIVEFIYNSYFEVKIDSEIKKFKYIINAQNLFVDTMKDIDDIYDQLEEKTEEQVDAINEQKYDDVENDEALDIEDERSEDEKEEFDMEVNDLD